MAKMKFKPIILDNRIDPEIVEAKYELWRQGDLSWKLRGKQVDIYNDITDQSKDVSVILVSRRFGKCLSSGNYISTPSGPKKIEDINLGDDVWGVNLDGTKSLAKVKRLYKNGVRYVYDVYLDHKYIMTCTKDHKLAFYENNRYVCRSLGTTNESSKLVLDGKPQDGKLIYKNGRKVQTYDIEVDNDSHLYLLESGVISHNSTSNIITALEVCIQNPLSIVKYACPTQKMVKSIILPILRMLFHDAPPEFSLEKLWNKAENRLEFPNGSAIDIAGTDNGNAEALRGAYAHLIFADEAAFMDDLAYVIQQVLLPQLDTTGGKLIMTSTPNYNNPQHDFHVEYVFPNEQNGKVVKFTFYDSPMIDDKDREKIIARYKQGLNDPRLRCEYLVEIPRTTENSIVPEFYANRKNILLRDEEGKPLDIKLPQYCDFYVSGDHGKKDLTVFLFGYYDFKEATLHIIDEWVKNGKDMTTTTVADAIKLKEKIRFIDELGNPRKVFKRVMDNNLQMIDDFRILHNLNFSATKKDNKQAAVNELRILIEEGRLKIHPRCTHTIYHTENGQWKEKNGKKEFAHLTDSIDGDILGGHCDALDALVYMVRNVKQNHNPYPDTTTILNESQHGNPININQTTKKIALEKLCGIKRKRNVK